MHHQPVLKLPAIDGYRLHVLSLREERNPHHFATPAGVITSATA